jgi:hypothetical protein
MNKGEKVIGLVLTKVCNSAGVQLRVQAHHSVRDKTWEQVEVSLWEQVKTQVWDKSNRHLKEEME